MATNSTAQLDTPTTALQEYAERFGICGEANILDDKHLGIINGHLTLNTLHSDVLALRGLYAPPYASSNFSLDARVAGETAPLIFTALGNQFWSVSLNQPIAALPLQIYVYALSPYDDWHRLAWAGSLVLIVLIVLSVSLVRYVTSRGVMKGHS